MKWYRVPFDHVLHRMSYQNFLLYGAVIPGYGDEGRKADNETIRVDDPKNRDRVNELIDRMV